MGVQSTCGHRFFFSLLVPDYVDRLLFNPLYQWLYKGPINKQIHKFIWSHAPTHYKISMMACTSPRSLT